MTCLISDEYYLFGAFYKRKFDGDAYKFSDYNDKSSLLDESDLINKIRPIPLTPIMINAFADNSDPQLWGSDKFGRLKEVSLGKPDSLCMVFNGNDQEDSDSENVVLRHSARKERINPDESLQLTIPPLNLLAQMVGEPGSEMGASDNKTLAENLASFTKAVNEDFTGKDSIFKLTQILPSQLAKYDEEESLTEEQQEYNQWREQKIAQGKPLKGFMMPYMHSVAVVFSDPLYVGAKVTLIKTTSASDPSIDNSPVYEVLSEAIVSAPAIDETQNALPIAMFNLDSNLVDDGFYLIQVEFWEEDYKKFYEEQGEADVELPQSVIHANVNYSMVAKDDESTPQRLYRYELHEKLLFKPAPGIGKIACVCGDMVSLEETLIQQFPEKHPSYADFATKGLTDQNVVKPGLAAMSITGTLMKTAESVMGDFVTLNGPNIPGSTSELAETIGLALWESSDKSEIPSFVMSGLALASALSASKESLKQFNDAKILASRGISAAESAKLIFKNNVLDMDYFRRLHGMGELAEGQSQVSRTMGRMSESWYRGNLTKRIKAIETAQSAYEMYQDYKGYTGAIEDADSAFAQLENMAEQYLQHLTYVQKYDNVDEWEQQAKEVTKALGEGATVLVDQQGVAISLYFQFNSAEKENQIEVTNTNFEAICESLCQFLEDNLDYQVVIEGFAGLIGTAEANMRVSEARAKFVSDNILGNANDKAALESRIAVRFYGKSQLVKGSEENYSDHNDRSDSAEQAMDRRADVRLVIPNYKVVLPPSRTGAMKLESIHQIWQSHCIEANDAKNKMIMSTIDVLCGMALFTPAAPYAAMYFMAKDSGSLMMTAADFMDDLHGNKIFEEIKEKFANKHDLAVLGRINKVLLKKYEYVNVDIEAKALSAEEAAKHLKSSLTKEELIKRFILRAYALNCLTELLATISVKSSSLFSRDLESLVEKYKVKEFIETYVMSEDWDMPLYSGYSLAQSWVNRIEQSSAMSYWGISGYEYLGKKIQGGIFNSGFPVQTQLYLDSKFENPLVQFARDFDITKQDVDKDDIGFSRLLVWNTGTKGWQPYQELLDSGNRIISPLTRVKLQIILKKNASEKSKSLFFQTLKYRAIASWGDAHGPEFEALFMKKSKSDFTVDPDNEISNYFKQQFSEGVTSGGEPKYLTGCEFEPSYWFGRHEIQGVKPLFPKDASDSIFLGIKSRFSDKSVFELWLEEQHHRDMEYKFSLGGVDIDIAQVSRQHRIHGDKNTFEVIVPTSVFSVGVDSKPHDQMTYTGQHNQQLRLSAEDLMIEDFVRSTSSSMADNTSLLLTGQVITVAAFELAGKRRFLSEHNRTESAFDFNWATKGEESVYVAILADEINVDAYSKMSLDTDSVQMQMQLSESGPIFNTKMHNFGRVETNEKTEYKQDREGSLTSTNTYHLEISESISNGEDDSSKSDFVQQALQHINENLSDYAGNLKGGKSKAIYVMKFELDYIAPTGKKVVGLRPFGKADEFSTHLFVSTLRQAGLAKHYDVPSSKLLAPAINDLASENNPWSGNTDVGSADDPSAAQYWNTLTKEERIEHLKEWLTKHSHSSGAPSLELKQLD